MNLILWILFGFLSGWVTSIITGSNYQQGVMHDIVLGIIGALIGGFVMNLFGKPGVTGFNLYSVLVAIIGASLLILVVRAIRRS